MRARFGSLADVLPIAAVEPDGLLLTTDGRYCRVLQCDRVPNTITAGDSALARIDDCFAQLCRVLPDRQSLVVIAQTDPVPIDDALENDIAAALRAAKTDRRNGHVPLAAARMRLMAATRQTVRVAAGADQPAVDARWWVIVPYEPVIENPREQVRAAIAQARGRRRLETHVDAAVESHRLAGQYAAVLSRAGIETYQLDGTQTLALLWERLHPGAEELPDLDEIAGACQIISATTLKEAAGVRYRTLEVICDGAQLDIGEHPARIRHGDGTLEETIHLGTPPEGTDPSWLAHLLSCPLPITLAVHLSVGGRDSERGRQRRRWARLRASVRYKQAREKIIGSDEEDALAEAEVLDSEIRSQIGSTVYSVGIYAALRDLSGDSDRFERIVKQTCSDFHALTNAKIVRGRHLPLQGFTSTLPLGVDRLNATRRYAQRNIAHCIPLTSSRCGCPAGLIVGTADPGGTLERVDPFDKAFNTTLTVMVGKGGGGKTVATVLLCARFIAQGGRLFVIDRSSTPDDRGDSTGTGHYDTLASLVPGSRRVQLGSAHGAVICPWDVPDIDHVPDQKIEFLLAFHALLIGQPQDQQGLTRTLDSDEEALLRDGITHVYRQGADSGRRPCEQALIDALSDRFGSGELSGANADKLQSLLLRLGPFGQAGTLAHIADRETSVEAGVPLVLFDFTGLSDRLAPALTLAVADFVEWEVHRMRRRRVSGELDHGGPWAGRAGLVIEEGWKAMSSPAAGAWLNEYARRARHYALWLIFVTQFFGDFDSEQGRAMLANYAVAFCFPNEREDLKGASDTLQLTNTDLEEILNLPNQKGLFATAYMISARGRGAIRIAPGPAEYWIASSNPDLDQPLRHRALNQTGGDAWKALTMLCDPAWHDAQADTRPEATV